MDDWRFDLVEILERMYNLHNDRARLTFRNALVLLQVKVQIVAITVFEYSAERVGVYFKHVEETHYARMIKLLVNIVLSQRVFDVVGFLVILPVLVELMYLTCYISLFF